jgi:hypothetical protein
MIIRETMSPCSRKTLKSEFFGELLPYVKTRADGTVSGRRSRGQYTEVLELPPWGLENGLSFRALEGGSVVSLCFPSCTLFPLLCVHVFWGWPVNPWRNTMLLVQQDIEDRGTETYSRDGLSGSARTVNPAGGTAS